MPSRNEIVWPEDNRPAATADVPTARILRRLFEAMYRAYGPQHWWPARSPTEVVIGAILVQNTNWRNVEAAIAQLWEAGLIDWRALRDVTTSKLASLIRPAGTYRVKAERLKNFVRWLWREYDGDLARLRGVPLRKLRTQLLSVNGIGRETADSIILYAVDRPTFVVDAYTARIMSRHGLIEPDVGYERLKALFEDCLPCNAQLYNEYHALLVAVGKQHCRKRARCNACPLDGFEHEKGGDGCHPQGGASA